MFVHVISSFVLIFAFTDGSLSTVETLASTAICGIIHAIFGGQPLLILGVAELTVMVMSMVHLHHRSCTVHDTFITTQMEYTFKMLYWLPVTLVIYICDLL